MSRRRALHPSLAGAVCCVCDGENGYPADDGVLHGLVIDADSDEFGLMCGACFLVTPGAVVTGWAS